LRAAMVVETFVGLGQQPSTAIQRVVFAAPMTHGVVLDAASALIELRVREVGSGRSALSVFRRVGFFGPSPEPDVRLPPHPALHECVSFGYAASTVMPLHGVGMAAPR